MRLDNVETARARAQRWVGAMAAALESDEDLRSITAQGCGFAAVGSVGRREAVDGSDVDLILLAPSSADGIPHQVLHTADRRAREIVRDVLGVKVSCGEDLTQPTRQTDIARSDRIGGELDTRTLLTRRVLLLTESVSITGDVARQSLRSAVFGEYFAHSRSKGKHMLSLVNDIVRYYRTVMIDYKAKVDSEGKTWAPRNVKLRHSRKFWYYATALALVAADRAGPDSAAAEKAAERLLDLPPTERFTEALVEAGAPCDPEAVLTQYDAFLALYGDRERREQLERLSHDARHASPVFAEFRRSSDRLHEAMLDCIDSLPAAWRRDLLSHFLL